MIFWIEVAKANNTQYQIDHQIHDIRIQAKKAHIHLIPQKGPNISIQSEKPIEITKEKTKSKEKFTLLISEKDFSLEKSPSFNIAGKPNKISIKVPVRWPLTVVLFQGNVLTKSVPQAGLFRHLVIMIAGRGSVNTRNTKGLLSVSQSTGDIQIHSHNGSLNIQGERANVSLQNCRGKMSVIGFKGRLRVDNSRGSLLARAFQLPLIVNKFKGSLNFRQERGQVHLKNMTGSISGYSKEGEIRGLLYPKEVNIETGTGKIHLDMPRSKAWVQADTWEGKLGTPSYFNRLRTGGMDRAQGRLKGRGKRDGRISLKSRSGSIKVYQSTR